MVAVRREELFESDVQKPYIGGGSLIDSNVVLTAAHKVQRYVNNKNYQLYVRLGDWDSENAGLIPHVDVNVAEIIIHPGYDNFDLYNNYALLILEHPVLLSSRIDTLCLPTGNINSYDISKCVATGWGETRTQAEIANNVQKESILKWVELPLVSHQLCQEQLRSTRLGTGFQLHNSFTCAGGEAGKDTCTGDGGSPLVCPLLDDPEVFHVIGLVSWGIGCGEAGIPGVYANINDENVINWITTTIDNKLA